MVIRQFTSEYSWLSNFYPCSIYYNKKYYSSVEAAFQAQKCINDEEQNLFINLDAGKAKRLGKKVKLRPDWETVKEQIMYDLLLIKFINNDELKTKLLATGDDYIIEGNNWGDRYWGVCPPESEPGKNGLNRLGELLMLVRSSIR